jgi:uncharacterized protein YecA (UPF0149 family)
MSLYKQWKALAEKERSEEEYESYWKTYFEKEKENYQYILENHSEVISGKLTELATKFNMDSVTMVGFLDGINSSLAESIKIDEVEEESDIQLKLDFEKLYFNMLDAKADWLYNLSEWDEVLDEEKRKQITKEFRQSKIAVSSKVGRNEPCPCGSGKKYKKCCGQ